MAPQDLTPTPTTGPGRILLVDDDALARQLGAEALAHDDHEVVCVGDGETALSRLRDEHFDLVVTDILMPGLDGLELLDLAKRVRPELDVILLTSVDSVDVAVRAMRAGAWHYLLKPINADALRLDVQRCLERRRVLRAHARLERHAALFEISQRISGTLDRDHLLPRAADALRQVAEADVALLCELGDAGVEPVAWRGITEDHARWLTRTLAGAHGPAFYEAEGPTQLSDVAALIPARDPRLRSLAHGVVVPLLHEDRRLGAAVLLRRQTSGAFAPRQAADLRFLGGCVAMALGNASRFREARARAFVDDLTGLQNAAMLERRLDEELARRDRSGEAGPFAVLFMDLDHFKHVNDEHGHPIGSKVLAEAARLLQRHVRAEDLLVRYGGDEFVAVLGDADNAAALQVAERMRRAIERHRFLAREGLDLCLTLCIGVAAWPQHAETRNRLLHCADVAMYHGKRNRRNAVYAFHEVTAATDRPKRFQTGPLGMSR